MTAVRFDIETDRPLVRKESGTRYVLARIVAPEGEPRQRPPVNLALVLDRSGSMGGDKIRLAKEAAIAALRRLEPRDRFAVVFYDERIDVVAESTAASAQALEAAVARDPRRQRPGQHRPVRWLAARVRAGRPGGELARPSAACCC